MSRNDAFKTWTLGPWDGRGDSGHGWMVEKGEKNQGNTWKTMGKYGKNIWKWNKYGKHGKIWETPRENHGKIWKTWDESDGKTFVNGNPVHWGQ